jgi:hypothetical protein
MILEVIFHPKFNAVFRFTKLARYFMQSSHLLTALCRETQRTFLRHYPLTFATLRNTPQWLNVEIAGNDKPILKNGKQHWIEMIK